MGEHLDREKRGDANRGPLGLCYERIGSADQLLALYEKFEQEHPEFWSAPVSGLLLGALRPLCADLFDSK